MCVNSLNNKTVCKKAAYNLAVSNLCINKHTHIPLYNTARGQGAFAGEYKSQFHIAAQCCIAFNKILNYEKKSTSKSYYS